MKNDARFLLNRKKWKGTSQGRTGGFPKGNWTANRPGTTRSGTVDARDILELKRSKSRMPPKIAPPKIQKQKKVDLNKKVQLMRDGNLFITSSNPAGGKSVPSGHTSFPYKMVDVTVKSKHSLLRKRAASPEKDDLEQMGLEDVMDLEDLPSTYVPRYPKAEASHSRSFRVPDNSMVADRISTSSDSRPRGGTVFVTNLSSTVSKQDLLELFIDVGPVLGVIMNEPGSATVSFVERRDALRACDTYHSRLLDGQPMGCFLQPDDVSQQSSSSRSFLAQDKRTPVLSRSRHDPRNVQFFVRV